MLRELEVDLKSENLYISSRLNETGLAHYREILGIAFEEHDNAWLAGEVSRRTCLKRVEQTRRGIKKVPVNAADTLAEGEFNRFYIRDVCVRAIEEGIPEVEVYRAKRVANPRARSEALIGKRLSPSSLLDDLRRSQGVEPALGLPPGPNSGLSVRLPRSDS